jgi:hypothetical protein
MQEQNELRHPARRGVFAVAVAAAGALATSAACVAGAPLGFSKGDNWTIPLVGALEDGPLVAPVYIDGKGPFLFEINFDADSSMDPLLVGTLDLYKFRKNYKLVDASDHVSHEELWYAEVKQVTLGDLTVSRREFAVNPTGGVYRGQPVLGIIGRDILSETLIWTIDRDRSTLFVATQGHASPPVDAVRVKGRLDRGNLFITSHVDQREMYLRLDQGYAHSLLWPRLIRDMKLASARDPKMDSFGRRRFYPDGFWAQRAAIGEAAVSGQLFFALEDKRLRPRDLDGVIGRDFLARFHATFNLHKSSVWLRPRDPDNEVARRDRLRRWGAALAECATPGCVTVTHGADAAAITFVREDWTDTMSYEVVVEALDAAAEALPLPPILVVFPARVTTLSAADPGLVARYSAATSFRVVDLSPFAPKCDPKDPSEPCIMLVQ